MKMTFLGLVTTLLLMASAAMAQQVVVKSKNLQSFEFQTGAAHSYYRRDWSDTAKVVLKLKNGQEFIIGYSFPGPQTYKKTKSNVMTSLSLIQNNITSYETSSSTVVCYKLIAFVDQKANSLEFTKQVVSCPKDN